MKKKERILFLFLKKDIIKFVISYTQLTVDNSNDSPNKENDYERNLVWGDVDEYRVGYQRYNDNYSICHLK